MNEIGRVLANIFRLMQSACISIFLLPMNKIERVLANIWDSCSQLAFQFSFHQWMKLKGCCCLTVVGWTWEQQVQNMIRCSWWQSLRFNIHRGSSNPVIKSNHTCHIYTWYRAESMDDQGCFLSSLNDFMFWQQCVQKCARNFCQLEVFSKRLLTLFHWGEMCHIVEEFYKIKGASCRSPKWVCILLYIHASLAWLNER